MTVLNLANNNYEDLLQNLARQLQVIPDNNSITIPHDIGDGAIKTIALPNGLQALMIKINFNKDVQIKTGNTNEGDFVLNFDESEIKDQKRNGSVVNHSFVRLTAASYQHWEVVKKNSSIQYLKILFSRQWLSSYTGLDEKISLFEKYVPEKSESGNTEKMQEEYRQIINDLWKGDNNEHMQAFFYQNRILLLIEQYFTRMHAELLRPKGKYKLTTEDVEILKKVELKLNTFTSTPPNIEQIAKKYEINKIRLAGAFKQVYGISIYNYYQTRRMQKAHELLTTQELSVKQTGRRVGYTNLSNFILAFKKQFNVDPKRLIE